MTNNPRPPAELRLRVLSAIEFAPGDNQRQRIKAVADRKFLEPLSGIEYQFTWRTISTWLYRFKKQGITSLDNKTRADRYSYRKVQPNELAAAINEVLPTLSFNKTGVIPKSTLYRQLLAKDFFCRSQLSQTSFYRMVKQHELLSAEQNQKLRRSFAMQFANEMWQADTMYGPAIKQSDGSSRKTFLIAFIDDASRVITHGEFFYRDNTEKLIEAFRSALFKRGKPERLYFDNGANYSAKELMQACLRLDIKLTHAPVRDGAAKGKIERFFRGFRDRFLTLETGFESLQELNKKAQHWIENDYNNGHHSGIQMHPIDRFNLDHSRIHYLTDDEFTEEVFYVEEQRKVSKTNVFSINSQKFECPVDLRGKKVEVRYDRSKRNRFLVYFNGKRMGQATVLNLHFNAHTGRKTTGKSS